MTFIFHSIRRMAGLSAWLALTAGAGAVENIPVQITVDAGRAIGTLKPIWRMFGADEPNYAYMKDGKKLIGELGALRPNDIFFRAHNLLTSGDGTPALKWGSTGVYHENAEGQPVYDWTILDRIFDTYRTNGVRPYAEIGFMPKDLSTKPEPYQHQWTPASGYWDISTGWAYPPKDYNQWGELVYQWVKHCVERYGRAEVEHWYWETWNEPNIQYWHGTREDFFKLHDYAVDGVRRALPTARVGGPDLAGGPGGNYLAAFLEHCLHGTNYASGNIGTPLDFIAFHAKGSPVYTNNHVRMGISSELRNIDDAFAVIARYPELRQTSIVIGECDPEGCAACQGKQLGYRNGTMYSSYTAASFGRFQELADRRGVNLDAALTWAFTFEGQTPFAGFRQLASCGIDLPVLNVFRLFSRMNGQRVAVKSDAAVPLDILLKTGVRQAADVAALAALDTHQLAVLAWHYHDDDLPGPDATVTLNLQNLPVNNSTVHCERFLVDENHGNAFTEWRRLGCPTTLTEVQRRQLEDAGRLAAPEVLPEIQTKDGHASLTFTLPRQGVSLLVLTWH